MMTIELMANLRATQIFDLADGIAARQSQITRKTEARHWNESDRNDNPPSFTQL